MSELAEKVGFGRFHEKKVGGKMHDAGGVGLGEGHALFKGEGTGRHRHGADSGNEVGDGKGALEGAKVTLKA